MKGFTVNKSNSKGLIIALIIAVVGALTTAWYFLWYVPHTPAYTLKIIHQAVQEKNADEVLRHVDVKSIVKNIVDREGDKYIDTSNPFGKAAVAATKTFGPALIEDVMRKYIEDPDSFKSEPPPVRRPKAAHRRGGGHHAGAQARGIVKDAEPDQPSKLLAL